MPLGPGNHQNPNEGDPVPMNNSDDQVNAIRDLEDFTRFQIMLPTYVTDQNKSRYRVTISADSVIEIRMFRALRSDRSYLYNISHAQEEMDSANNQSGGIRVFASSDIEIPIATYFRDSQGNFTRSANFIFEGSVPGRPKLTVTLRDAVSQPAPKLVARDEQWLYIAEIEDLFEQYSVGGDEDQEIDDADHGRPDVSPLNAIYPPEPDMTNRPWEGDYILAVHGFNVSDFHKEIWFGGTMAKRLWHTGYRGRLGLLRWPCHIMDGPGLDLGAYPNSTYNAWRAGIGLRKFLETLNTRHSGVYRQNGIRLYCHSQANVVGHQALIGTTLMTPANVEVGDTFTLTFNVITTPARADEAAYRAESGGTPALPTYALEANPVSVSYVATAATVANVTAGLAAAWNEAVAGTHADRVFALDFEQRIHFSIRQTMLYNGDALSPIRWHRMPLDTLTASTTDGGGNNTQTLTKTIGGYDLVEYFISTQAAIPASAFDSTAPMTTYTGPPLFDYPNTPDVFGRYPCYPLTSGNATQRPYFLQLNSHYGGSSFFRLFNTLDFAIEGAYEVGQAVKPNGPDIDGFFEFDDEFPNRFDFDPGIFEDAVMRRFPADTFGIFTWGAESRIGLGAAAAGGVGGIYPAGEENELNLATTYEMGEEANTHRMHSLQFGGNMADDPQTNPVRGMRWAYWRDLLTNDWALNIRDADLLPDE